MTVARNTIEGKKLEAYIQRIEGLRQQRAEISAEIAEEFKAAKASNFCTKTMRKVIAERAMDREKLREANDRLDEYRAALDLLG